MKKTNKIVVALCIMVSILMISVTCFADVTPDSFIGGTLTPESSAGIVGLGKQIVAVVRTVGTLVAVVILLVLGIKYMMGSAEEKADYKKSMIPYVVGAVILFASTTIVGIVVDMADALNKGEGNQ